MAVILAKCSIHVDYSRAWGRWTDGNHFDGMRVIIELEWVKYDETSECANLIASGVYIYLLIGGSSGVRCSRIGDWTETMGVPFR